MTKKRFNSTTPAKENATYRVGDMFYNRCHGVQILAQVECNMINLISLLDGNRWQDAVSVKDIYKITQQEFAMLDVDGEMIPLESVEISYKEQV